MNSVAIYVVVFLVAGIFFWSKWMNPSGQVSRSSCLVSKCRFVDFDSIVVLSTYKEWIFTKKESFRLQITLSRKGLSQTVQSSNFLRGRWRGRVGSYQYCSERFCRVVLLVSCGCPSSKRVTSQSCPTQGRSCLSVLVRLYRLLPSAFFFIDSLME
jgi:hypothetical protein